ncbi:plant UBX domain-containing protein 1-like [Bidens hawaiensis]|uniref:plant UBX domain-containing protein 1-like n=1 Tax=Bidens hawaiensis TaxID=980011 RepID=UPI00404B7068
MLAESPPAAIKRRRFTTMDATAHFSTEKLAAAKENYGREISVFDTTQATISQASNNNASEAEEPDDLEFTAEDYYHILATKKEDKYLKTKKIRDAEAAARRSTITKAVVRVRFPDNHTLEATFHPSETMQSLIDLLVKVVARPDLPFYIYTTPPKKQIKDFSQDLYSAGFAPGAIVYFSYDLPKGVEAPQGPFLKEDVLSLKGLEHVPVQQVDQVPAQPASEPVAAASTSSQKPAVEKKKMVKPKWLKM